MISVKEEVLQGTKWVMIAKFVTHVANFFSFLFLARVLSPAETGILGLTGIFFALANTLKDAGLGTALIRKQDRTEADCSTVFWLNILTSILVGCMFWSIAPWFASFFSQPALKWITRVSAIMMVFSATQSVHFTLYQAKRDFKPISIINMFSALLAIPIALVLAYNGWSYWSLVFSGVCSGVVSMVAIWLVSPWKPKFIFSFRSAKELLGFGYKLSLSSCVWCVYNEITSFIIGKFYSPSLLAVYDRAKRLSELTGTMLFDPINGVMFPIMSKIQHDEVRLLQVYRKVVRMSMLGMIWILLTLLVSANPIITLLYGDKWISVVPYLQILCIGNMMSPLIRVNHSYICVKGRSDLILMREVIVRVLSLILMLGAACCSVMAICWAYTISCFINLIITMVMSIRLSKLGFFEQCRDFVSYVFIAAAANVPSILLDYLNVPYYCAAIVGPAIAFVLYIVILNCISDSAYCSIKELAVNLEIVQKLRLKFHR